MTNVVTHGTSSNVFVTSGFLFSASSHVDALIDLFWLLLGVIEEDKIAVKDPAFRLTAVFGRLFFMVYVVCTVITALNMLIAMMNNSFEKIMVRVTTGCTIAPYNAPSDWLNIITEIRHNLDVLSH